MPRKFGDLDPLLHSQLRLAVISLLVSVESADFNYLLEETEASKGNLSVQLSKLKKADYITIEKTFKNNYPLTICRITKVGIQAFENYVNTLKGYLNN